MYKRYKFIIFMIIFMIGCTEPEKPVIKIGKIFDKTKEEVTEETDTFTIKDILAYTLSQTQPFNTDVITRRIYKGKVYIDMIQRESVDINIEPGLNKISGIFRVRDLLRKYGSGDFMILLIINESVIAKKAFMIERPKVIARPDISEETGITAEKPVEPEKGQPSIPMSPMSPGEIMRE